MRKTQCMDCKFAKWDRTSAGRLHPSGDGRCKWTLPEQRIPVAFYFLAKTILGGGLINRNDEWRKCNFYQNERGA